MLTHWRCPLGLKTQSFCLRLSSSTAVLTSRNLMDLPCELCWTLSRGAEPVVGMALGVCRVVLLPCGMPTMKRSQLETFSVKAHHLRPR